MKHNKNKKSFVRAKRRFILYYYYCVISMGGHKFERGKGSSINIGECVCRVYGVRLRVLFGNITLLCAQVSYIDIRK